MDTVKLSVKRKDPQKPAIPENLIVEIDGIDITDKTTRIEFFSNAHNVPVARLEVYAELEIELDSEKYIFIKIDQE